MYLILNSNVDHGAETPIYSNQTQLKAYMTSNTIYCTYITFYRGNKLPPFYIGSSSIEKVNNGYHGSVASKEYKQIWVSELNNNPDLFETKILSRHSNRKEATEKENKLQIATNAPNNLLYVNKGYARTNFNYGVKQSAEHSAKISKALKGVPKTPEHIKNSANSRQKSGKTNKGIPMSEEQKIKISKSTTGIPKSPEHIANYSISRKANNKIRGKQQLSQNHKDAIAAGNKGKLKSLEHRKNLSGENHGAFKGYYVSPELTTPSLNTLMQFGINIKWYSNLDKEIPKITFLRSKYINAKWSWEELQGKTFRDIGLDFIPK